MDPSKYVFLTFVIKHGGLYSFNFISSGVIIVIPLGPPKKSLPISFFETLPLKKSRSDIPSSKVKFKIPFD